MQFLKNIKLQEHEKAKHVLLNQTCDTCFYFQTSLKPPNIYCLRNLDVFSNNKIVNENMWIEEKTCRNWKTNNLSLRKNLMVYANATLTLTLDDIQRIDKILESEE